MTVPRLVAAFFLGIATDNLLKGNYVTALVDICLAVLLLVVKPARD